MDQSQFETHASEAFGRFAATLRLALNSIDTASDGEEIGAAVMSEVAPFLSASQIRDVAVNLKEFAHRVLDAANRAAETKQNTSVRMDLSEIEDPEVRGTFRLVQESILKRIHPISNQSYAFQAAIVSTASSVEVLALQLFEFFYKLYPRAIPGTPQAGISEILTARSANEILSRFAEKAARDHLSKRVDEWLRALAPHCGISLADKPKDWDPAWRHLAKIFVVRNCILHAGGVIDQQFIERMSLYESAQPPSRRIELSQNIVRDAVKSALYVGVQLYIGIMYKQSNRGLLSGDANSRKNAARAFWQFVGEGYVDVACELKLHLNEHLRKDEPIDGLRIAMLVAESLQGDQLKVAEVVASSAWPEGSRMSLHKYALIGDPVLLLEIAKKAVIDEEVSVAELLYDAEFVLIRNILGEDAIVKIRSQGPGPVKGSMTTKVDL